MPSFSQYKIIDTVSSGRLTFQRALLEEKKVLLCSHSREGERDAGHRRAVKEYRLFQSLDERCLLRPLEMLEADGKDILVFEDPGGMPLEQLKLHRSIPLIQRFELAVELAGIVQTLHSRKILHLGIAPRCIFYSESGVPRLIAGDLSRASQLDRLESESQPLLAGDMSLAYIPPEQTGLVHRPIDQRSDLYSLGAVLYFLFTGRPPFTEKNPSVLVHQIIATLPDPVHSLDPHLPGILSAILSRSLAKDPDDRYRSIRGLISDLQYCLDAVRNGEEQAGFKPGQTDRSEELRLPSTLYGREEELALLKTLYEQTFNGNKNVLIIESPQGGGRTSLIREMQRELSLHAGFFAHGHPIEGDQGTASFLTSAIEPVLTQILSLPEIELDRWKAAIHEALPADHSALLTLFPSLEWLTDPEASFPVEPAVIRQQWISGCRALLNVLSPPQSPMLLFIDDLHLIAPVDMEILSAIIEQPAPHSILIVLSLRSENVPPTLESALTFLERSCGYVRRLKLPPVSLEATQRMLADLFSGSVEEEESLAILLNRKTEGNPFYLRELLLLCREKSWIEFSATAREWSRDLDSIEKSDVSANVIHLLTHRILELDPEERQLLQFASIIGEVFDLFTLHWVSGWTVERLLSVLRHLYRLEFIRPDQSSFSLFEGLSDEDASGILVTDNRLSFRFSHERIRKAAYDSTDPQMQKHLHAYTGLHLLELSAREPDFMQKNLYTLVAHLNAGHEYLDENIRERLVALNLEAGYRAVDTGDQDSALVFFRAGLNDSTSTSDEGTLFELRLQTARAEALAGSPDVSETLFDELYALISDPSQRLQIYAIHIPLHSLFNRYEMALERGNQALKEFGALPDIPDASVLPSMLVDALARLRLFRHLETSTDFQRNALLQILSLMAFPAAVADNQLYATISMQSFVLLMESGLSEPGPAILSRLISLLIPNYELAQELAGIASIWLQEHESLRTPANLYWFSLLAAPLTDSDESILLLEEGIRRGYETGEIGGASRSLIWLNIFQFFAGKPLDRLQENLDRQITILGRQRQEDPLLQLSLWKHALQAMQDRTVDATDPAETELVEAGVVSLWKAGRNSLAMMQLHCVNALILYMNEDLTQASKELDAAMALRPHWKGTLLEAACLFLDTLILHRMPSSDNEFRLRRNASELRLLAYHAPRYYGIWYGVAGALSDLHEGRRAEAVYGLEESLTLAIERDRLMDRALIEDLLFNLYRSEGKKSQEIFYFTDALTAFRVWGPILRLRKMMQVSHENANILITRIDDLRDILKDPSLTLSGSIDSTALLESSSAIASEITLEGVIRTILELILRFSGAESGQFLYRRQGQFRVVARAESGGRIHYDPIGTDALDHRNPMPVSMLLFSLRTGRTVLEHNAFETGDYRNDPYIQRQRLRSALCLPLQRQGEITGILYLENRWTGHTFHPARMELLRQLTGQMAVSLANADHYESLEEQIRIRTHSLEDSLLQVGRLKQQQDVDYYLISVLLRPLLQNETKAERFAIDFLIRQKKRFRFKRWMVEIGGDLCFGSDLVLRGRRYSVLVNGDGMGKSLQGSGGAIVLGSVLKSIVERTRLNRLLQEAGPEDWLIQAIREIHHVFATFNGVMFVTAIVSLLDEESGTLYYINGGHPRPVLLRRGKASLIGEKVIVHKPGMKYFEAHSDNVESLRFDPGDTVIFGTDGRDDVILDYRDQHLVINEDETLFLRIVEEADGKLREIYRGLRERGVFSDDLALIRIAGP